MEEDLTALFLADAGISAEAGDRVNWAERPQEESLPAVILWKIGGSRDMTMDGPSGLVESRLQVDCWAADALTAKRLALAVINLLQNFKHSVHGGTSFQGGFIDGERDSFENEAGSAYHRVTLDARIWHSEV